MVFRSVDAGDPQVGRGVRLGGGLKDASGHARVSVRQSPPEGVHMEKAVANFESWRQLTLRNVMLSMRSAALCKI